MENLRTRRRVFSGNTARAACAAMQAACLQVGVAGRLGYLSLVHGIWGETQEQLHKLHN